MAGNEVKLVRDTGFEPVTPTVSSSRKYECCNTLNVKNVASANSKLSPGDIFNPHRQFYGTWIPQWLEERREVSERAKKLYAYLTYFAGGKGKAWPSYNTLAEKLHVTRRHVIRLLCELSKHRLIKVTHVDDPTYGRRANLYEFLWHEWMQHSKDKNFKMMVPEESPPEEILNDSENILSSIHSGDMNVTRIVQLPETTPSDISDTRAIQQLPPSDMQITLMVSEESPPEEISDDFEDIVSSIHSGDINVTRIDQLPSTTPSDISDTRVIQQLPPSDMQVTPLVTPMSPRSQENKKKRINYKLPTSSGACRSLFSTQAVVSSPPKAARHSAALVRKSWKVARKLLHEFWDNCKIRPDLRILFGYASRALRSGYQEKSIRDAFERALHQCHGHATDCGKIWEASSTVHRAEKWLKENGTLWKPTPLEEIRAGIAAARKAWEGAQS